MGVGGADGTDAVPVPDVVALFATCVVDVMQPDVGVAAVRVLRATGCDVRFPSGQTCCGQPAWNSGFAADAARVARTTLAALEAAIEDGATAVVAPSGSCTTMVRVFWPELFELAGDHDAAVRARRVGVRTFELCEFVAGRSLPALSLPEPTSVAYHHSCHMLRELRVHEQPVELLDRIDGCRRVMWADDERCCGFGGLFSFKLPEASVAMADDKLASVPVGPDGSDVEIVGADSSCLLHLRGRSQSEHSPVRTRHIAEVLAAALGGDRPPDPARSRVIAARPEGDPEDGRTAPR